MTAVDYVYIMASRRNGTIYIGVTSDLVRRVAQHRSGGTGGSPGDMVASTWSGTSIMKTFSKRAIANCR